MNKNATAYSFAEATSFIQDGELLERLIKIRLYNPDIASIIIGLLVEIYSLKEKIGIKQSSDIESRFGQQTELTTKFVYLFQDLEQKDKYKIGISKNVTQRSRQMGCKVAILGTGFGGDLLEFRLHQKFKSKRIWHRLSQEWFTLDKNEVEFTRRCIDAGRLLEY